MAIKDYNPLEHNKSLSVDVAEKVHVFYTECRVIDRDNLDVTSSRLALVLASKIILKNALHLLGVSAPEHM